MSSKALSKKSLLGMENEFYLFFGFFSMIIVSAALFLLSCIEFVRLVLIRSAENKEESTTILINLLHPVGFAILLIPLSVMHLKWFEEELKVTVYSPLINVAHFFFVVLYLYNPWIIEYRNEAYRLDVNFLPSFTSIVALFYYVVFTFPSTWILWKISKVKPDYDGDEPYLVIYGDEGSETKKLLDDSE